MDKPDSASTVKSTHKFTFRKRSGSNAKKENSRMASFECSEILTSISLSDAKEMHNDLMNEYCYSVDQLVEVAGLSCATAIIKSYPKETMTKSKAAVLVVCGPGYNGGVGLVCARYLKMFGYRPTIFHPRRTPKPGLYALFAEQCEKQHIPFLSYMPSEAHLISNAYNIVIDALLGCGYMGPSPEEDMAAVIQTVIKSALPIVSIDIPSGWEIDNDQLVLPGNPATCDGPDGTPIASMLVPDVLISLMVPKRCSRSFQGVTHYLVSSYVPPELLKKFDVILPACSGLELCTDVTEYQCHFSPHDSPSESAKTPENEAENATTS